MQTVYPSKCGGKRLKGILDGSSTDQPLVTVITAIYNGQAHVEECLESVLRQDYPNTEHIILDGGSNDGTVDVLRRYEDRIAFWSSEPDKGVYDAWNKGLLKARGEWICFLGVDDQLLPGAVSAYMKLAATNPQAEYLSSQVRWIHPSGYERIIGRPWMWPEFSRRMYVAHVGSMHRRTLYNRLGAYDTSYRSAADYELLLRARGQLKASHMCVTTAIMQAGGLSNSSVALAEEKRAKIAAGGRNKALVELEFQFAKAKFALRPLRRALGRVAARYGLTSALSS